MAAVNSRTSLYPAFGLSALQFDPHFKANLVSVRLPCMSAIPLYQAVCFRQRTPTHYQATDVQEGRNSGCRLKTSHQRNGTFALITWMPNRTAAAAGPHPSGQSIDQTAIRTSATKIKSRVPLKVDGNMFLKRCYAYAFGNKPEFRAN